MSSRRTVRACRVSIVVVLVALAAGTIVASAAAQGSRPPGSSVPGSQRPARELALDLARLLIADPERPGIDEQVTSGIMQSFAGALEERLHRRLLDVEWDMLTRIVRRFVAETLPPSRAEEIAAEIYLRHFTEAELEELLRFQRSPLGQKAARLTPVIGAETVQAIDNEIVRSPARTRMFDELRRAFPALDGPQSP